MSLVLQADSIGKSFGSRRVLTAATLSVQQGQITALLGRNGCGKSTLLRILTGLVHADHGRVLFHGRHWTRPSLNRMAGQGLFLIPERDLLCRGRTVREHFRLLIDRYGGTQRIADFRLAVQTLEIAPLLDRAPEMLSGGERRRAELALAFARRPACLLADEPFLGIAPKDAETVTRAIRDLASDGAAVLVTGHEIELLLPLADDVVWMTAGTTYNLGSPARAAEHYQFRREYLGPARARFHSQSPHA
jgi:ABC-type multidrug transport system ATPase subunit